MSGLGSGRGPSSWAGLSLLVSSITWGCAKEPTPGRETTAVLAPAKPQTAPATAKPAAPPATVEPVSAATARAAVKHTDFASYWQEMRAALLSGSAEAVAPLAAFPFTVRGEMDDDPVRHVERAAFPTILRQLLAQDVGLSPEPEPLSKYLNRMTTVPPGAVSGATARVASMQFALRSDGWRFVGAYLGDAE